MKQEKKDYSKRSQVFEDEIRYWILDIRLARKKNPLKTIRESKKFKHAIYWNVPFLNQQIKLTELTITRRVISKFTLLYFCAHFSALTRIKIIIFLLLCAYFSVVACKIRENFDAQFSNEARSKIPRILVRMFVTPRWSYLFAITKNVNARVLRKVLNLAGVNAG